MDKTESMLNFIQTCPYIENETLFFNFSDVRDNAYQMITKSDDISIDKQYIDGSELKRFSFSIDGFKAIAYNPVIQNYADENLDDFKVIQQVLDWIDEQDEIHNYPDFGENCIIEEMHSQTNRPALLMVDTSTTPPTAIYRVTIRITYLDKSKAIFKSSVEEEIASI